MKISELLITEAISLTQYESALRDAIYAGMKDAIKYMGESLPVYLKSSDTAEEFKNYRELAAKGESLLPMIHAIRDDMEHVLASFIEKELRYATDKVIGHAVTDFEFKKINSNTGGYAAGLQVVVNSNYTTKELASRIMDVVYDSAINESESASDLFDQVFKVMKHVDRNREIIEPYNYDKIVENMLDIIIHELVHVKQHKQQYDRGRKDIEYRSYLNKTPNELKDLLVKNHELSLTPAEQKRYNQLYYASPQEMAAFAHNIAQRIIRFWGIDDSLRLEDLPTAQQAMTGVKDDIRNHINPTTIKTQRVYNRYVKLVYQEVDRYIDYIRAKIIKNNQNK